MNDNINRELDTLGNLVDRAADLRISGTYLQRNPDLGRMVRCPFCSVRRRQNQVVPCCNTQYLTVTKNTEPRSQYTKKRKNPRLSRNHPPFFDLHQRLLEMERSPGYVEYEGLSQIVEAAIISERKEKARIKRNQQKYSRKQNRK